jgi:hypothetical protein
MKLANIRYKDNTKMDLRAIKFPDVSWIYMVPHVAQWIDCVNMVMGIRLLYKEGNITVCEI